MIRAGAACFDITPPPGVQFSGFAARSLPATGAHDRLTARAIVVDDTAILVADVIGINAATSARIRKRCALPEDNVVIAALHTHGGPASMPGRLGFAADPSYLERLEDACIAAVNKAAANRRPATLKIGAGTDPEIARNRRHSGGVVDNALPVLQIADAGGNMIAIMTAYACHPVVLAANNLRWTADYPHFVRQRLETAYPGAMALFITGCAGDANTGHSAQASVSLAAKADRSFEAAKHIGHHIADCVLAAEIRQINGPVTAANATVQLGFSRRETESDVLASRWQAELKTAEAARQPLLRHWINWAQTISAPNPPAISARVTRLAWAGMPIIALPGEVFAETALSIRAALPKGTPAFVLCFAEDNPGYIPPKGEYEFGGYEIDEAHRYYGQPATFAPGSAEKLADAALALLDFKAI